MAFFDDSSRTFVGLNWKPGVSLSGYMLFIAKMLDNVPSSQHYYVTLQELTQQVLAAIWNALQVSLGIQVLKYATIKYQLYIFIVNIFFNPSDTLASLHRAIFGNQWTFHKNHQLIFHSLDLRTSHRKIEYFPTQHALVLAYSPEIRCRSKDHSVETYPWCKPMRI